ncbi:MAG TPA: site-specific DNA-methyltransferase, partial [Firmicutes bacterium]|nr:site-specific DNA-methyltransferase [Bacillota bacterium]
MLYKLFQGDCLDVMRGFPAARVDMIFADPPYRLSNDGLTCQSGRWVSVNKGEWDRSEEVVADHEFHLAWLGECKRLLKDDGTLWVSGTYHAIFSIGYALQLLGFRILNDICWFKPNASPNLSRRYFTASHETLIWAAKSSSSRHYFDYDAMRAENAGKQMRSMWPIPSTPAREKTFGKHPTQKPLTLLRRIVSASSRPGDIVLDPFCGSGTTER